ncbi:MAG: hypothetical protein GXZ13_04720 [Synergistaceae bacterium]|jgi:hypothetical protein|nr:hypothetical protein [Synergistaceae bacterium]
MRVLTRRNVFFVSLFIALLFALFGLIPRYTAEKGNKTVALIAEYKDLVSLALQEGKSEEEIWSKLKNEGMVGIAIPEYTGEELFLQSPLPLEYGSAKELGLQDVNINPSRAVVVINKKVKYSEMLAGYIKIKMPTTEIIENGSEIKILLPGTVEEFRTSAFLPDFLGLDFCKANNVIVLYRPGQNSLSSGEEVAKTIDFLLGHYPQIKNILPAGAVVSGYPNLSPIASVIRTNNLSLSQVEFVKQIGVSQLASKVQQNVLSLHSLTKEEIISKRISQPIIWERYLRAVHERSVRLIILRPYELNMGDRFSSLVSDIATIKNILTSKGYALGWPSTLPYWTTSIAGAVACAITFIFCMWIYVVRLLKKYEDKICLIEILLLILMTIITGAAMFKIPLVAKLLGGLCTALIATEAAIFSLGSDKKPFVGAILGLFVLFAGGLSIAAFYGTVSAVLRLTPFSGVKLTLLLPPLLLILHDFKLRIHPESFTEILKRPALWGELVLIGVMMIGLFIVALRSDNVSSVPAIEVTFRSFIEKIFLVRPRTKEFMLGYPALVVYWFLVRNNLMTGYREALRIGASLAFCSAINTFCHFHTFLIISFVRVVNGWWLGLSIGALLVFILKYIALPLLRKLKEHSFVG